LQRRSLAVCTDGLLWAWSVPHKTWLSVPIGTAEPSKIIVTADAQAAMF